jgi:hypothetical protein
MLISIATLTLLGLFMLSANNVVSNNQKLSGQSEHSLTALSLAQSLMDEMKSKSFDKQTVNPFSVIVSASSFTPAVNFGPDSLEMLSYPDRADSSQQYRSASTFNDLDDYRRYVRVVNTPRAQGYTVRVDSIYYVNANDPREFSNTQTYCKRIDISVICPAIAMNKLGNGDDLPIRLSYAITF